MVNNIMVFNYIFCKTFIKTVVNIVVIFRYWEKHYNNKKLLFIKILFLRHLILK